MVEQTVAQYLKDPKVKDRANSIKNHVATYLGGRINAQEPVYIRYVNWFTKELLLQGTTDMEMEPMLNVMWGEVGDYIVHHLNVNQLQSRFNQKEFRYNQVVDLAHQWYATLDDPRQSRVGREGRAIIDLSDVGFRGWKWVSLDRGSCEKEGAAGGHCGNTSGNPGDNILSLRDDGDRVHLTFINNRGLVGEMKGRGNAKPSSRYHPAIIKLLLSNFVGSIGGGGYMPQNNFALTDLTPEQQEMVRKQKPFIDEPEKFKKHRDKLEKFYLHKQRVVNLRDAKTDEDFEKAINTLAWKRVPEGPPPPYELDPEAEERRTPDIVQRHRVWRAFEPLLHETYIKARTTPPEELFAWMDRAIKAFMKIVVEADEMLLNKLDNKSLFMGASGVSKLEELVHRLLQDQPDILKGAPRRSRFRGWKEYQAALERYVNGMGYDLPPWNPRNNHIISYEFNRKMEEELHSQGQSVFDAINKVVDDDKDDPLKTKLHGLNMMHRDQRMNDPNWEREMRARDKAERRSRRDQNQGWDDR